MDYIRYKYIQVICWHKKVESATQVLVEFKNLKFIIIRAATKLLAYITKLIFFHSI